MSLFSVVLSTGATCTSDLDESRFVPYNHPASLATTLGFTAYAILSHWWTNLFLIATFPTGWAFWCFCFPEANGFVVWHNLFSQSSKLWFPCFFGNGLIYLIYQEMSWSSPSSDLGKYRFLFLYISPLQRNWPLVHIKYLICDLKAFWVR